MNLADHIRDIPDYPRPGVLYRDISPLLADGAALKHAVAAMADPFAGQVDVVVGIEARGFVFAAGVALHLGVGFVPVRKPGKLPRDVHSFKYDLEYGSDELQMHTDGIAAGLRVLVVDDVLATGGTAEACTRLIAKTDAKVVGCSFLIDLVRLGGADRLMPHRVESVIRYDQDDHEAELSPSSLGGIDT